MTIKQTMVESVRPFLASIQRRILRSAALYFSSSSFMMAARCNMPDYSGPALAGSSIHLGPVNMCDAKFRV